MTDGSSAAGNRTALLFANVAHFYSHVMMLIYPTVVIALEVAFARPYGELLSLSFVGFVLYGLAALPAGWLGDKWSAPAMLAADEPSVIQGPSAKKSRMIATQRQGCTENCSSRHVGHLAICPGIATFLPNSRHSPQASCQP